MADYTDLETSGPQNARNTLPLRGLPSTSVLRYVIENFRIKVGKKSPEAEEAEGGLSCQTRRGGI